LAGQLAVTIKNIGQSTWRPGEVGIGTARPHDRTSVLYRQEWLSLNRVSTNCDSVAPGETIRYIFPIGRSSKLPNETFQLVVDGKHWIPNTELTIKEGIVNSVLGKLSRLFRNGHEKNKAAIAP